MVNNLLASLKIDAVSSIFGGWHKGRGNSTPKNQDFRDTTLQILIIMVILDYFGCKIIVFFDFEKIEKFQEIFGRFWEIFRKKLLDIKLLISKIFENSFLKMQ